MTKKYRPSNGSEGDGFFASWCMRCARDKSMSEGKDFDDCAPDEVCRIIGDTMAYNIDDPKYPVEWQYDNAGRPVCTAFIPLGATIPAPRCTRTRDMFEEPT